MARKTRFKPFTLAHVTHEAVEQIGGIGTVLQGLMTSPVYQEHVGRSILIGPTSARLEVDPEKRLGELGKILYSSVDNIDRIGLAGRFHPIEWAFDVSIIYGTRSYDLPEEGRKGEAEVLLIDVFHINKTRLNVFKTDLWEKLGIDCLKYEAHWDFEEYARLAQPAHYALRAILDQEEYPCILFAHEFMGLPAAQAVMLSGQGYFRTVFHAHECSTARRLVEHHPGHDTMFYNALQAAQSQGMYVEDVFGPQDEHFRHALISRAHMCDGVIAVGDYTGKELKFLNKHTDEKQVDVVYNGLPALKIDMGKKESAREMLRDYAASLIGVTPDILMTHATRPVVSKGLWRDLAVVHHMDPLFAEKGITGVLFILTTAGGVRRPSDVQAMHEHYGWPRNHQEGYPDLVGPEVDINRMVEAFNKDHRNIQVVLVNQFGFSRERISPRLPEGTSMELFRIATDVEFGMATYEPFGISPLEPLGAGAICVISNVCGCEGFVRATAKGAPTPNVITADFTQLDAPLPLADILAMTEETRSQVEAKVAKEVAIELVSRLPLTDEAREKLLASGRELVSHMGWDNVLTDTLIPLLNRVRQSGEVK